MTDAKRLKTCEENPPATSHAPTSSTLPLDDNEHRVDEPGWGATLEELLATGRCSREQAALAVRNGSVHRLSSSSAKRENDSSSSSYDNVSPELRFALRLGKLKRLKRTGWVLNGIENPESVAEHSFRVAALSLVFACNDDPRETLDAMKTVVMGLVHDVPEAVCGDIVPTGAVSSVEKHRLEDAAMREILDGDLGRAKETARALLSSLWTEHERRETRESRLVKDLDRLEMCIQAYEYEREDGSKNLQEFFDSVRGKLKDERVQTCFEELLALRKEKSRR